MLSKYLRSLPTRSSKLTTPSKREQCPTRFKHPSGCPSASHSPSSASRFFLPAPSCPSALRHESTSHHHASLLPVSTSSRQPQPANRPHPSYFSPYTPTAEPTHPSPHQTPVSSAARPLRFHHHYQVWCCISLFLSCAQIAPIL